MSFWFFSGPNGKISLTWYVTAKEDIADFTLLVKGKKHMDNQELTLMKKNLAYSTRSAVLSNFPSENVSSENPLLIEIMF